MTISSIRVLRRTLLGVAVLTTLCAVFVAEENWRGDRAWRACEADLIARGFDARRAPTVPAEQNLFLAPVLRAALDKANPKYAKSDNFGLAAIEKIRPAVQWSYTLHPFDLAKARQFFIDDHLIKEGPSANPAADIRTAIQPADPFLDDVCAAVESTPHAAWTTDDPLMEHFDFGRYRLLIQLLVFRAKIALAVGEQERAFRDLSAVLTLVDRLVEARSTLINVMIAMVADRIVGDAIQTGYADQRWTPEQLQVLQERLSGLRPLARLKEPSPTGERLGVLRLLDLPPALELKRELPWWLFHGWVQQNKVTISEYDDRLEESIDAASDTINAQGFAALREFDQRARASWSPYRHLLRKANMSEILPKLAKSRDGLVAEIVGIAVERYYLANGHYPTKADDLVPQFLPELPRAAMSGQPAQLNSKDGSTLTVTLGEATYTGSRHSK